MPTGVRSGWIGDLSKKLYCHIMEMEQMMACLLAEIRTNQEKTDANEAKMDASLKEMKTVDITVTRCIVYELKNKI
jgi:transcription termination factor NusB